MKNYKVGVIIGTLSIISTLMIVRVPIGDKMVAIGFFLKRLGFIDKEFAKKALRR
mgnify:CR=1 FL=1